MFGSDKSKPVKPAKPTSEVQTLIGEGTTVRGDISFTGGLHVNGAIEGAVSAVAEHGDALLVLSEHGRIRGQVQAPHVVLNGLLEGDVIAAQKIELASGARVHGNIYYRLMEMAAGAQVSGQMIYQEEPQSATTARDGADAD